jgi:hypothetical protein
MSDTQMEDYAAAFGRWAGFGLFPALLQVDCVLAYFDRYCPLYAGAEGALTSDLRARAAVGAACVPVMLTNPDYHSGIDTKYADVVSAGENIAYLQPLDTAR